MSPRGVPFSDLRELNTAINDLFELAEVTRAVDTVLTKQNGGIKPPLSGGEFVLRLVWKKTFGSHYEDGGKTS